MELIGLILGTILFLISTGLAISAFNLIKTIIKAREDGNISREEEILIEEAAKKFTGSLINAVFKLLKGGIKKDAKVKDVLDKIKTNEKV